MFRAYIRLSKKKKGRFFCRWKEAVVTEKKHHQSFAERKSLTWGSWQSYTAHKKDVRRRLGFIISRFIQRNLMCAFNTWVWNSRMTAYQWSYSSKALYRALRRWGLGQQQRAWDRWVMSTITERKAMLFRQKGLGRLVASSQKSKVAAAFRHWGTSVKLWKQTSLNSILLARRDWRLAFRILHRWNTFATKRKHCRGKVQGILKQWLNRSLAEAFRKWRFDVQCLALRTKSSHRAHQRSRVMIWESWQQYKTQNQERKKRLNVFICRWTRMNLMAAWSTWSSYTHTSLRRFHSSKAIYRSLRRWSLGRKQRAWDRWMLSTTRKKDTAMLQRQKLEKLFMSLVTAKVDRAFKTWLALMGRHKRSSTISSLMDRRDEYAKEQLVAVRTLHHWFMATTEAKRQREKIKATLQRWLGHALAEGFRAWKVEVARRIERADLEIKCLSRWLHQSTVKIWNAWQQYVQERKEGRRILMIFASRWAHINLLTAWSTWVSLSTAASHMTFCRSHSARALYRALRRAVLMRQEKAWDRWVHKVLRNKKAMMLCRKFVRRLERISVEKAWRNWQDYTWTLHEARSILTKVMHRQNNHRLYHAYAKWYGWTMKDKDRDRVFQQLWIQSRQGRLSKLFGSWNLHTEVRKRNKRLLNLVLSRLYTRSIYRGWVSWTGFTRVQKSQERGSKLLSRLLSRLTLKAKNIAWKKWASVIHQERRLRFVEKRSQAYRRKQLLRKSYGGWVKYKGWCHSSKRQVQRLHHRWWLRQARGPFGQWKEKSIRTWRQKSSAALISRLLERLITRRVEDAWGQWYSWSESIKSAKNLSEQEIDEKLKALLHRVGEALFAAARRRKKQRVSLNRLSIRGTRSMMSGVWQRWVRNTARRRSKDLALKILYTRLSRIAKAKESLQIICSWRRWRNFIITEHGMERLRAEKDRHVQITLRKVVALRLGQLAMEAMENAWKNWMEKTRRLRFLKSHGRVFLRIMQKFLLRSLLKRGFYQWRLQVFQVQESRCITCTRSAKALLRHIMIKQRRKALCKVLRIWYSLGHREVRYLRGLSLLSNLQLKKRRFLLQRGLLRLARNYEAVDTRAGPGDTSISGLCTAIRKEVKVTSSDLRTPSKQRQRTSIPEVR